MLIKVFQTSIFKQRNNFLLSKQFCVHVPYMNPEKHINTGHNVNNTYEDIVGIGDFPLAQRYAKKEFNRDYIPKIEKLVFALLDKQLGTNLSSTTLEEIQNKTWEDVGVQNIDAVKQSILHELSQKLFIKENKYRWPIEQKHRFAQTMFVFNKINSSEYVVGDFFDLYNSLIQVSISRSHLWQSPQIKGDYSMLEKHMMVQQNESRGVPDLERNNAQNQNFINKFMAKIHSI